MFLFKYYLYNTDRKIRVYSHNGLVEINKKDRLPNINNIFIFTIQYQQMYYTYTHSFRNNHNRVDLL